MTVDDLIKNYELDFPNGENIVLGVKRSSTYRSFAFEEHYSEGKLTKEVIYRVGFEPIEQFNKLKQEYDKKFDVMRNAYKLNKT